MSRNHGTIDDPETVQEKANFSPHVFIPKFTIMQERSVFFNKKVPESRDVTIDFVHSMNICSK